MRESSARHVPLFMFVAVLGACGILAATPEFTANANRHLVHIEGRGVPTVILAAGLGDTLEVWHSVQAQIAARCTRTFAYNRTGYNGSAPASGPRDAETIVSELRAELQRRAIHPPYVLVGHSLGGLYMQYFARKFPGEVSGLVLVDSTHWNQGLGADAESTGPYMGRRTVVLYMTWIARRELVDSARAGIQVHESPHALNLPTIVLSSTGVARGETPVLRAQAARLQEEIVADFPAARHLRVAASGHYIQHDRPEVVINAARELAGCAALPASRVASGRGRDRYHALTKWMRRLSS